MPRSGKSGGRSPSFNLSDFSFNSQESFKGDLGRKSLKASSDEFAYIHYR